MLKVLQFFRKATLTLAAVILVAAFPFTAWADDPPVTTPATDTTTTPTTDTTTTPTTDTTTTPTTDTTTTTPAATTTTGPTDTTGPNAPQGPSANTYTYNPDTGLWQNQYYSWNPATGQTTPLTSQTYSYNPATSRWDTTDWIYDPAQAEYIPNIVSVVQPPAGAITLGGPTDASTSGPNSPISGGGSSTGQFDNFYNASISNSIVGRAISGNANVSINTTGGSATSGKAMDIANIINLLQSTTNLQGNLATFSLDIAGNVQGDITIDPSQLGNLTLVNNNTLPNNLTINSQGSGQINNDIALVAQSGDATVSQNTTAGNATTGDAAAIANIVNVINSIIGAGSSFIGTINIKGNLDGDILLPPDTLNALLAAASTSGNSLSTSGPNSPINTGGGNNLTATLTDNNSINNTLSLSAASGSAAVTNNTTAGNAATGDASTNLTVLNLTGKQVVGQDALLVFVNVMGKWVGMIVNAPTGSTSAALCNCDSSATTAGPNSPINSNDGTNTNINSTNNSSINNNVTLGANSGNALVSDNTTAGNATSGNASSSLNLLNISTSSLSLSNWLGILFINVFGSWNGSFGINTTAGDPPASTSGTTTTAASAVKAVKVFGFIPHGSSNSFNLVPLASATNPTDGSTGNDSHPVVLSTVTRPTPKAPAGSHSTSLFWTAGSLFALAGILSAEEAYTKRKEARMKFRKYIHGITVRPLKRF